MASIFDGIRVLDITNNIAGPVSTQMLADYGADVIKIERPVAGDDTRGVLPKIDGQALVYLWANRGKKSVTLALDDPRAQQVIRRMAADADVFIESYKPGTMKKYGLDYETLQAVNPNIIYCSVSMAGQTGAYSQRPGFDILAQAMSGLMDMTGQADGPPTKSGTVVGDYVGALNAFGAITAALFHRERGGEGQYIDISLLDGLIAINTCTDQAATLGTQPTRMGAHHNTLAPYGIFRGNNKESCIIAAYTANMWRNLCKSIGQPELADDPRFCGNMERMQNLDQLVALLELWLRRFERIDDAVALLVKANVAACKIRTTAEMVADPTHWENGVLTDIPVPPSVKSRSSIRGRGPWLHFSKTPGVVSRASDLGEYNEEVLSKYGMTPAEIAKCQGDWSAKFRPQ